MRGLASKTEGGWILVLTCLCVLAFTPYRVAAQAVADPRLSWRSIRTTHFNIHYHEPLGLQARRVAVVAEQAWQTYARVLDASPTQVVEVVLTDDTDSANGSATALPYNTIRLYSTAPEDLSPLGDYDDWITTLVDHEDTHIAQLDSIRGIPAIVNRIFGKVFAPHHAAPRWLLEGLAVFEETDHTSGGRLRSTMWDMFVRADVLGDRVPRLDQISHTVDRWPHGNIWYLYGSQFVEYVGARFGREAFSEIVRDASGELLLPLTLNWLPGQATEERTFTSLYSDFVDDLRARYATQVEAIVSSGVVEGEQVTFHGEEARTPRFLSDTELAYWANDNRHLAEIRVLDLAHENRVIERIPAIGDGASTPVRGGLLYSSLGTRRDIYTFNDLYRYDRDTEEVERLTLGWRAAEPDVSANGRYVTYTRNNAGTTHLMIAALEDLEATERVLRPSERFEQVYSPRFSPDQKTIAASFWRTGGYRDIGLVDVATGQTRFLMHDRAMDTGPAWSPDGAVLYFASDRTGVSNLYAYTIASGELRQVTNVILGAYMPTVSPSGTKLAYISYSTFGWHVCVMDLHPDAFRPSADVEHDRPASTPSRPLAIAESTPYSPWPTILPTWWMLGLVTDSFGYRLNVSTSGEDVVGLHGYRATVGIGLARGDANVDLAYDYRGLPLKLSARLYRFVQERGGLQLGGRSASWVEDLVGGEMNASYSFRRLFYSNTLRLTYAASSSSTLDAIEVPIDPSDPPPRFPYRGPFGQLRFGWTYSSVRRFAYDISPSDGATVSANASWIDPGLGAPFRAATLSWSGSTFVLMPYLNNHVVALRYGGGVAFDSRGPRSAFSLGGFPGVNLVSTILELAYVGGVALRGFPQDFQSGAQFHLAQSEYRLPLWRPQRGLGTAPFFLHRLYGTAFIDAGTAFDRAPSLGRVSVGVGAELFADLSFFYYTSITLRVGYARGLTAGGIDQFYFHLGTGF